MSMIEQIKRLREKAELFKKSGFAVDGIVFEFEEAANTIEELSAKMRNSQMERSSQCYNGGWIPCSERLPEKQGYYIATFKADEDKYIVRTVWYKDNEWTFWMVSVEVLAWMPLPEPYKEREVEND